MTATTHQEHPIRQARRSRRWSQQEVGGRLTPPVNKATVSQWEADITQPIPALALQLVDLFDGEFELDDLYRRARRAS